MPERGIFFRYCSGFLFPVFFVPAWFWLLSFKHMYSFFQNDPKLLPSLLSQVLLLKARALCNQLPRFDQESGSKYIPEVWRS